MRHALKKETHVLNIGTRPYAFFDAKRCATSLQFKPARAPDHSNTIELLAGDSSQKEDFRLSGTQIAVSFPSSLPGCTVFVTEGFFPGFPAGFHTTPEHGWPRLIRQTGLFFCTC